MRPLARIGNPLLAVGTAALLFVGSVAWKPAFALNAPTDPIGQMEVKYFEHTYPNDTQEQRLDRLEKLVFGEVKTGSDDERVSSLLAAIPNLTAAPSQDAGGTSSSSASSGGDTQGAQQDQTATGQDQGGNQSADAGNAADYSDYPSVTALEMFFFHKSFQGEPVKHRLDQLESKAFGHVNAVGDLSDRVDKLEEAARKQNHGVGVDPTSKTEATEGSNGMGGMGGMGGPQYVSAPQYGAPQYGGRAPQYNSPMPPAGWQGAGTGLNANVDQLEQMEFGRTFGQMSLLDRVKQLETRIFPHEVVDAQASIPDRVNTMMQAAHLSSGAAPGAYPGYAATQGQSQSPPYYGNPAYNPNAYASAAPQTAYGGASGMYGAGQTQYTQPQYSQPQYQQPQYGQQPYGQPQYGTAGNTNQYQAANQQEQQQQQNKGHPLIKGLAKVLGAVGSMALNSMGSMNFGSGGYGMPYGGGMPFGGYPTGVGGFWP